MRKFRAGDKVVPVSKRVFGWEGLENSGNWRDAQGIGQGYLYIVCFDEEENAYVCSWSAEKVHGDFFLESDLIPYCEFKAGDQVENKDRSQFSNEAYIVTVDRIEYSECVGTKVYFQETGTWDSPENIELVPAVEPEEDENEPYRRCVDHFSDLEPAEEECCQCAKPCEPIPEYERTELLEHRAKELEEKVRELENQKDELKFIIKILAGQF